MKNIKYAPFITLLLAAFLFSFLYFHDNKYTAGPPYGENGVFEFTSRDLERPLFLIDGWEFFPDEFLSPEDLSTVHSDAVNHTFIGEYSNFSQIIPGHSPFGQATYRITLRCDEPDVMLALDIPEIFSDYTLWAGDRVIASTGSGRLACFPIHGEVTLVLAVQNYSHYYSGLVYPPALGTPSSIEAMVRTRTLFYSLLCMVPTALALFSCVLWLTKKEEKLFFHFGFLCLAFALSCLYPLVPDKISNPLWYGIEDSARLIFFAQTLALTAIASGCSARSWYTRIVRPIIYLTIPGAFVMVVFIIPLAPSSVNIYGFLIGLWYVMCWLFLTLCAGFGLRRRDPLHVFPLCADAVLGVSLLSNLLDNNSYEPAYTGWQSEYAGFLLVLLFAGMMIWRNRLILKENNVLTSHLEELVAQKTSQLEIILNERKDFFSDMAHSLKSPLASIHGYIHMIREHNMYTDQELLDYLDCIDKKNIEMSRRIQSLNTLNAFDRIHTPWTYISITGLLENLRCSYEPECIAAGIHLVVNPPSQESSVFAQEEKLMLLFENLIYNALSFTPENGSITISAQKENSFAAITVSDTGMGISSRDLPHIFERFYTVRKNPMEGSGLGLYIVRLCAEEMGGCVTVQSVPEEGSVFTVKLPLSGQGHPCSSGSSK